MSIVQFKRRLKPSQGTFEWAIPSFPLKPHYVPRVENVEKAYLSPVEHGPLHTLGQPRRYIRGAVYDHDGTLVTNSQKLGGLNGHPWVPADPSQTKFAPNARRLEGRWLYGGHWMQHFGHFITEGITTLWNNDQPVDGLVFHKYHKKPFVVEPWMTRLLELSGFGGIPIDVIGKSRARTADLLIVPSRTIVANGWGEPEAQDVWDRVAAGFRVRGSKPQIYLSRTEFNRGRRDAGNERARSTLKRDREMDAIFADSGFTVIAPETLTIDEQIGHAANASIIAGPSGSALHLSAFAEPGTKVLELGDDRNATKPLMMQQIIDRLGRHPHAFVTSDTPLRTVASYLRAI